MTIKAIEEQQKKGAVTGEDAMTFDLIHNQLTLYVAPNGQVSPINPNVLQALLPTTGVTAIDDVRSNLMTKLQEKIQGRESTDIDSEGKMGDNKLSIKDINKLDQWKYRPENDLYLKHKTVFDNPNYYDQKTGEAIYPGTRGDKNTHGFVDGKSDPDTMKAGSVYMRYGSNGDAQFFTGTGTPYEQLSLPPGSDSKQLLEITVLKDIPCSSGYIVKWFDQPGGGKQYFTDILIKDKWGNMHKATLDNLVLYKYIKIKVIK